VSDKLQMHSRVCFNTD